jgi:putative transposase
LVMPVTVNSMAARAPARAWTRRSPNRSAGAFLPSLVRVGLVIRSMTGLTSLLEQLARELERTHPGAAASLREGMAETLTILRLGVPPTLARTLHSTNPIESMIEICREHSRNVKRWRNGQMALRWCAAGMLEADHQFRRVNGHLHLPKLRAALDAHFSNVSAVSQNEDQKVA